MTITFHSDSNNNKLTNQLIDTTTTATTDTNWNSKPWIKRRQSDKQTSYSIMNRESLLAIVQYPTISKLINKYKSSGHSEDKKRRQRHTGIRSVATVAAEMLDTISKSGGGGGGGPLAPVAIGNNFVEPKQRDTSEDDEDLNVDEIFHEASETIPMAIPTATTTATNSTTATPLASQPSPQDDKENITATTAATTTSAAPTTTTTTSATTIAPANGVSSETDWQLECKYTLSEVQEHNTLDDCWMVIFDKVYNITEFVYEHPGGDFILFEYAGRDATHPFLSSRHGSSAYKMLDKYWIGILVDEELYYSNNSSYCSVYLSLSWRSKPTLEENKNHNNNSSSSSSSNLSTSSGISSDNNDSNNNNK